MNDLAQAIRAIVADLGIDAAEMERRLQFLEFTPQDEALLLALHAEFARRGEHGFFVEKFYDHLLAFGPTRTLIADDATLARLKRTQGEYFERLTAGRYDLDYLLDRLRIGVVHERVGLKPQWYIGAYSKYLALLAPRIRDYYRGDPEKTLDTLAALLKIVFYDIGLAVDTYIYASERALHNRNLQLETINRLSLTLTSAQDLTVILDQVMVLGSGLVRAKAACIAFYDADRGTFNDWVTTGLSPYFVRNMAFQRGGLADEAFTSGACVLSNDRPETRHQLSALVRAEGIRGFVCLPLISRAGKLGVIYFYRSYRDDFEPAEIELLTTFAHLAASAIENARLYARLESEARTDTLTGLYNRRVFDQRLEQEQRRARRYNKPYALLMLDIDHFKRVNDEYGHPAGDAVLAELARRMALQVRDVDTLVRYGGEEFAVIFPEITGAAAREIGERIRRTIADTPFVLPDGRPVSVTVSAGISCFPNCAADAPQAVGTADQALYTAKQEGRNRVLLYRDTLKARLEKNPELVVELLNRGSDQILPVATAVASLAPFLRQHTEQVGRATALLAGALKLPPEDCETLRLAALLHDIGMLAVPAGVLARQTPLTAEEQQLLRRHPVTAAAWLERVPALSRLTPIVRHHHEHFDGRGYPDGLRGNAIPVLAQVLALADAYASMISDWPGRRALSTADAEAELRRCAGTQFDPLLVDRFLQALAEKTV